MTKNEFTLGQTLHGFVVDSVDDLPTINATMIRLTHQQTGARFMHIDRDDDNHLFSVGFRTPPDDSTGVAHILEHTVLCGSQRYPVRDPFFSMLKRSLNSFMNAMTASDWTVYPFSSMNRKDFLNLLDIYLDAAFFPRITERDFSQEGHRLEFSDMENPESPLEYKGVVYNEMKGAMSDPSGLLSRRMDKHMFPTTTYRHNSGGEPEDIPSLTWQQLREFHASYYHPSNAWFYTAGNLDLAEILQIVEDRVLKQFDRLELNSEVPLEQRLSAPQSVTERYPLDAGEPLENRSMVQLGWLCCDINDSFEQLSLSLLATLLLGNPAAPLYKALLDSGLGANLAPGSGYHDDNRTTFFTAGLQGTDPDKAEAIEELILSTLAKIADEGFSKERIEGAIHRLEFGSREVTGDSYPYALLLMMKMIGPWIHGGDPKSVLDFQENLDRLRSELEQGPYFENLIRAYLLKNPHRINLLLKPDHDLGPVQEAETRKQLDAIQAQLTDAEKEQLIKRAVELKNAQEGPEDLSCLPTLELSDIPAEEHPVACESNELNGIKQFWFDQPTNGIGVVSLHFDLSGLDQKQILYLPVFGSLLTQVGAGGRSYLEMAARIEAVSGGVAGRTALLDSPLDINLNYPGFEVKGKALVRNAGAMLALLGDIILTPDFSDLNRLSTVLKQLKVSLENSVPQAGHSYAARRAAAFLSSAAKLREEWSGLSQIALVKELAGKAPEELQDFSQFLTELKKALFNKACVQTGVTVESDSFQVFAEPLAALLEQLEGQPAKTVDVDNTFDAAAGHLGLIWSIPVNYVAKVFRAVPFVHEDSAALTVLSKLLRAEYLHREIREKGGAYGGLAGYNSESGMFSMLSYRDPQLVRTLKVYEEAVDWIVSGGFSDESVTEAIIAVFSDIDKPLSPAGMGAHEFANRRQQMTLDMRNHMRQQLLSVTRSDLQRVALQYLKQGASSVAVLAGEGALQKANTELSKPLNMEKI